MEVIIPAVFPW